MRKSDTSTRTASRIVAVILAAGILFMLYLQSGITDEVFFNGDGGLKLLMTKQYAAGDFSSDLRLPAPSWAHRAWSEGLYPFHPPFVYTIGDRHYQAFPIYLPLITSPFYKYMGLRGLYAIPIGALLILWFSFRASCRRLGIGSGITSIVLINLIFSTPLTLYTAMYWEHTIAVALAFAGLSMVLIPPTGRVTKGRACAAGVLSGLSAWFRPEMLSLLAILSVIMYLSPHLRRTYTRKALFLASALSTVLISWVVNLALSGHLLGFHSWQVLYGPGWPTRLSRYWELQSVLSSELLLFLPALVFPVAYSVASFRGGRKAWTPPMAELLSIGVLLVLALPLTVPNSGGGRWGPRYLLILAPVISLLAALALRKTLELRGRLVRYLGSAVLILTMGFGFQKNAIEGTISVRQDYVRRVLPALNYIRGQDAEVVVVSRQWISQDLAAALPTKIFFRTTTSADLAKLAPMLHESGNQQFIYLSMPGETAPQGVDFNTEEARGRVAFTHVGRLGHYRAYRGFLLPALSRIANPLT